MTVFFGSDYVTQINDLVFTPTGADEGTVKIVPITIAPDNNGAMTVTEGGYYRVGGAFASVGGPCDDGDACTVGDACVAGACVPGTMDLCMEMVMDEADMSDMTMADTSTTTEDMGMTTGTDMGMTTGTDMGMTTGTDTNQPPADTSASTSGSLRSDSTVTSATRPLRRTMSRIISAPSRSDWPCPAASA